MSEQKKCSNCFRYKPTPNDFYFSAGKARSECKACTIKRNIKYQKKVKSWKYKYVDDDTRKTYMREYYQKNKEKFAKYREEFKERYPEYYKEYFRDKKKRRNGND